MSWDRRASVVTKSYTFGLAFGSLIDYAMHAERQLRKVWIKQMNTVWVMLKGKWIPADWDKSRVGCYLNGVWFNMATFEAYTFESL